MTRLILAVLVAMLAGCHGVYHDDTYPVVVEHDRHHPYMHGEQADVEMYPESYER